MYGDQSRKQGVVSDFRVAPERRSHHEDHIVPHLAVMADMCICHQETAVPDDRGRSFVGRPVHGHSFAETVVVSDLRVGDGSVESVVLRIGTDRRKRIDHVVLPHRRIASDERVRHQPAARSDFYIVFDNAVRTDHNILRKFCGWIDNGGGMNLRHGKTS